MTQAGALYPSLHSNNASLELRQQPQQALVTGENKDKTRKAVDPPPIVQLKVRENHSPEQGTWLVNPFLFMVVHLVEVEPVNGVYNAVPGNPLLGSTVSSLHRLKDVNNKDGGFFVFGDVSCRQLGAYRLQFNLFDIAKNQPSGDHAVYIASQVSDAFSVVTWKDFKGQIESTLLSRTLSDQGVRLRLRKEKRTLTGSKRPREDPSMYTSAPQGGANGHKALKRLRADGDYTAETCETAHFPSTEISPLPTQSFLGQPLQAVPLMAEFDVGSLYSGPDALGLSLIWSANVHHVPLSALVGPWALPITHTSKHLRQVKGKDDSNSLPTPIQHGQVGWRVPVSLDSRWFPRSPEENVSSHQQ